MNAAGCPPVDAAPRPDAAPDAPLPAFRVLGVRVHAVQIPEAVRQLAAWGADRSRPRYVVAANAHVANEARRDTAYARVLEEADLVVADGTPLKWAGRLAGFPLKRRVYGPELMLATLEHTAPLGLRHFFYGAGPGVAADLAERMAKRFPGLVVAGVLSPPFAPFSDTEDPASAAAIREARPDILWVSLGAPKQERWMRSRRDSLGVPLMVGVGAAFDFHTGRVSQAPRWMRENGLEWFYRLLSQPRRLWKRYLVQGPEFAARFAWDWLRGRVRAERPQ